MKTFTSRRAVLAGAAVLAASAVPAAAFGLPAIAADSDIEILALGAELNAALAVYEPLCAELLRLEKIYHRRNPKPRALLVRQGDASLFDQQLLIGDRFGLVYLPADVQILLSAIFTRAIGRAARPGEHDVPIDFVPDTKAAARAAEIVKAHDEYDLRSNALLKEIGLDAIEKRFDEAYRAVSAIVIRIPDVPATTIAGLRIKARAANWCHDGSDADPGNRTSDERLAWSIVRDLLQAAA